MRDIFAGALLSVICCCFADTWKRKVESYREWFIDDEKYRNQEDKRLGEPKTPEKIFGVAGSFRKLQVD